MNSPSDQNCLNTSTSFPASAALVSQPNNLAESKQLSLLKSTPMLKQCCDRTFQECQSTQTSETTTLLPDSLTSLPLDFPVPELQSLELGQDYNIQHQDYGEKLAGALFFADRLLSLLNSLRDLSDEDFEQFWDSSSWQATRAKLKLSRRRDLEHRTSESDSLLFPTPTACSGSNSRPAGQTKLEKWFKDRGLIAPGSQLSPKAMAMIMGFPQDWLDCLYPTAQPEDSKLDISLAEPLLQDKQRSPSVEFCTSTNFCTQESPKKNTVDDYPPSNFLGEIIDQSLAVESLDHYSSNQSPEKNQTRSNFLEEIVDESLLVQLTDQSTLPQPFVQNQNLFITLDQFPKKDKPSQTRSNFLGDNLNESLLVQSPKLEHNPTPFTFLDQFPKKTQPNQTRSNFLGEIVSDNLALEPRQQYSKQSPRSPSLDLSQTLSTLSPKNKLDQTRSNLLGKTKPVSLSPQTKPPANQTRSNLLGETKSKFNGLTTQSPNKPNSPSNFLGNKSLSFPCLVQQPQQELVKGVVVADLGDRFVVRLAQSQESIQISKLWVYPDFPPPPKVKPKSSKPPASGHLSPVVQRKKDKSGRIVEYPKIEGERVPIDLAWEYPHQFFWIYNWSVKDESGCWKNRSKSVPRSKIWSVKNAIATHKPVLYVLDLIADSQMRSPKKEQTRSNFLGEKVNECTLTQPGTQSNETPSNFLEESKSQLLTQSESNNHSPSNFLGEKDPESITTTQPQKKRREHGEGSGSIRCKPIQRNGKEYKQYWYHYELWQSGNCTVKSCKYIPQRSLVKVQALELNKAPVKHILTLLGEKYEQ